MHIAKLALAALAVGLCVASVPTQAQTYYSSRASFNAANPGLALETFDEATPNRVSTGPIDKNTNDGVFTLGQIADGLRIDAPGSNLRQMYVNNSFGGNLDTTTVVTTNYNSNTADISFYNNDVTVAGLDLFNGVYTLNIFGVGNTLLGTQTVDASKGAFFGVSASQVITHIGFNNASTYETYDNIAFGRSAPAVTPEPGSVALLAGMGMTGMGLLARRRKQARKAA